MKRCPSCGDVFIPTATRCPTCEVDLVGGDEPVVYSFLMADDEAVANLERLMSESAVPFELADDELIVPGSHAVAAERVLDHLDQMLGVAVEYGTEVDAIELYDWEDHELDQLEAELRVARVRHTWDDDGALLVPPDHVAEAELVIDRVMHPHALAPDDDTGPAGPPELLSDLFLAADGVRKEPWNLHRIAQLRDAASRADDHAPPYGVDPATWTLAVRTAHEAVAASDDGSGDEDVVVGSAERVRAVLRPLV